MKTILAVFVLAFGLSGCAHGPEARIKRHETLYAQLTPEEQDLIRKGEIRPGYTADMVKLALGEPSSVLRGRRNKDKQMVETWSYTDKTTDISYTTRAVRVPSINSRSDQDWDGSYYESVPHYHTRTYLRLTVLFYNGRVVKVSKAAWPFS